MSKEVLEIPKQTFLEIISEMPLHEFIDAFCFLYSHITRENEPLILWPRQVELCKVLDTTEILFWPKARQVGGSLLAGIDAVKIALSEPKSEIIIVSKKETVSRKFLKKNINPILKALPTDIEGVEWGTWEILADTITFSNGSIITSLASDSDAGRGETVRLVIMDEASAIDFAKEIWKSIKPTIEKHPYGQMLVISNSKNGSWFNRMLKKVDDGKTIGIDLFFMNSWTDPARDENWKQTEKSQYDNEVDFYTEFPETIKHMFLKREGFVYPTFKSDEGSIHHHDFEPDFRMRSMWGYDHGFDHWAVFLQAMYDQYNDHLWIYDELYVHQKDISEISGNMINKIELWANRGAPETAWRSIADSAIFAQHGQKPVSELIKGYTGISFQKSIKYNELGSMDMLRSRFTQERITIHPRCHMLIQQTRDLTYDKNGKPRDKDNDGPDVLKYFCAELKREDKPKPPAKYEPYNRGKFRNGGKLPQQIRDANLDPATAWQRY